MATSLRPSHPSLDVFVPSEDVAAMEPTGERFVAARPATRILVEIGGSAAWLAWQIEADELLIHEAQSQLRGISEGLERYRGRMPEDLRGRMLTALQTAQLAADQGDLSATAKSVRDIRSIAEQYRATTMGC